MELLDRDSAFDSSLHRRTQQLVLRTRSLDNRYPSRRTSAAARSSVPSWTTSWTTSPPPPFGRELLSTSSYSGSTRPSRTSRTPRTRFTAWTATVTLWWTCAWRRRRTKLLSAPAMVGLSHLIFSWHGGKQAGFLTKPLLSKAAFRFLRDLLPTQSVWLSFVSCKGRHLLSA